MLLASRRLALIFVCLAGMEMAWFTPLLFLLDRSWWPRPLWAAYCGLLGGLLLWMFVIDWLSRRNVPSPRYEISLAGLSLASSLLLMRLVLHASRPLTDISWLPASFGALFDLSTGLRAEWGLLLVNLFLWQRAASASSRDTGFFSVGVSFRLGMLFLIATAGTFSHLSGRAVQPLLWVYFGLGLLAVSVARINERANTSRSAGTPLPWQRLLQVLLAVFAIVLLTAWLSQFYTPGNLRIAIGWLRPVWDFLGNVLMWLLQAVFWLLMPALLWLEQRMRALDLAPLADALQGLGEMASAPPPGVAQPSIIPPWVGIVARDLGILLVLALAVGLVLLYLERTQRWQRRDEAESESGEQFSFGGETLGRGVQRLLDLAALVRRFGLSSQLLAAVSVQNIYANLSRLARQRGYPRRPAQPPDAYLPMLVQAFGGHGEALERITAAYMRVHYGNRPVTMVELAELRADYDALRAAKEQKRPAGS